MKATYKPKNREKISTKLWNSAGKIFNFQNARPNNGVRQYWPDDILFPGSPLVPATDLEFEKEQNDVYCPKCSGLCNVVYHLEPVCSS